MARGVGGHLDELGGLQVRRDHGDAGLDDRREDVLQPPQGPLRDPEHQPVRAQGVLDRETLAEELGVPGKFDLLPRGRKPVHQGRQPGRRPDGDGRLADDQGPAVQVWGERRHAGVHVGEVGGEAVLAVVCRRRRSARQRLRLPGPGPW